MYCSSLTRGNAPWSFNVFRHLRLARVSTFTEQRVTRPPCPAWVRPPRPPNPEKLGVQRRKDGSTTPWGQDVCLGFCHVGHGQGKGIVTKSRRRRGGSHDNHGDNDDRSRCDDDGFLASPCNAAMDVRIPQSLNSCHSIGS